MIRNIHNFTFFRAYLLVLAASPKEATPSMMKITRSNQKLKLVGNQLTSLKFKVNELQSKPQ